MSGLTAQLYTVSNPHNKTRQYRAVLTQLGYIRLHTAISVTEVYLCSGEGDTHLESLHPY